IGSTVVCGRRDELALGRYPRVGHFLEKDHSLRRFLLSPCWHGPRCGRYMVIFNVKPIYAIVVAAFLQFLFGAPVAFSEGNAARAQRAFGACAACHSLQPDQNMTGPSLAGLWNRKAGSLTSFNRYSAALKSANIVWNDKTLEDWITDPQHLVPGNEMTFAGIN